MLAACGVLSGSWATLERILSIGRSEGLGYSNFLSFFLLAQLGSFLLLRLLVTFIKNTDQLQDLTLFLIDCDSKLF